MWDSNSRILSQRIHEASSCAFDRSAKQPWWSFKNLKLFSRSIDVFRYKNSLKSSFHSLSSRKENVVRDSGVIILMEVFYSWDFINPKSCLMINSNCLKRCDWYRRNVKLNIIWFQQIKSSIVNFEKKFRVSLYSKNKRKKKWLLWGSNPRPLGPVP